MAIKVCIFTSTHLALDVRIFHREARTLAAASYDVTLIGLHDRDETIDGVKIIALPAPRSRFHRMLLLTGRIFVLCMKQRANIYHFHDPDLLPAALLLKLLTGGKVLYDVHEDYGKTIMSKPWIPPLARRIIAPIFNVFEKITARLLDRVVAATDGIKSNFSRRSSIAVRNYPILNKLCFAVGRAGGRRPCLPRGSFNLVYAGILAKVRGIWEIVQALDFVNTGVDVRLKLLGEFRGLGFEEEVRELKAFEKTEFLGWVPLEQAYQEMALADAGIVCFHPEPNHVRALPNKLFEYMAVGLPVIASRFQLWRELVEQNKCGLVVDPLNPREIAQAMEWLAKHPDEAREMGENGRRLATERYNWERESRKLLDLYGELVKR